MYCGLRKDAYVSFWEVEKYASAGRWCEVSCFCDLLDVGCKLFVIVDPSSGVIPSALRRYG
jgi:hypothetical protein